MKIESLSDKILKNYDKLATKKGNLFDRELKPVIIILFGLWINVVVHRNIILRFGQIVVLKRILLKKILVRPFCIKL